MALDEHSPVVRLTVLTSPRLVLADVSVAVDVHVAAVFAQTLPTRVLIRLERRVLQVGKMQCVSPSPSQPRREALRNVWHRTCICDVSCRHSTRV